MTVLRDIDSAGNGPNANTSIDFTANAISLNTNATTRIAIATNGRVVLGAATTVPALVYVNGSSANLLSNASVSGNITLDFATANNFTLLLSAATTLLSPVNATTGQSGVIFVVQPSAGNATLSYNAAWTWPNGTKPTASTMANAVDSIVYMVRSVGANTVIAAQFVSNFS